MNHPLAKDIFEQIVKARGIKNLDKFINYSYSDLADPKDLPDINKAYKAIELAIKNKQKIGIYGDYDIDGLCATALLIDALESFGAVTTALIPDRFEEGYGLSKSGIKKLADKQVKLVVTVDCGSNSEAQIKYAKDLGITVVVTDHHEVTNLAVSAEAVVNPKRKDSKYGFSARCGAGVAFGLVQYLQTKLPGLEQGQEKWLLDLVALATISDVVSLIDENRILAGLGLKVLNQTKRVGLQELIKISGTEPNQVDETVVSFRLAPRLNASGRLEHAKKSLELLICKDKQKAKKIAHSLNNLNSKRQLMQKKILTEALSQAEKYKDDKVLVLSSRNWSHGINGIVASKLSEQFFKPVFVMQDLPDGTTKGSARSLEDYNLADALESVRDLLISGGGHKLAAGATIKTKDLSLFRKKLNNLAGPKQRLDPAFSGDISLDNLSGVDLTLVKLIDQLRPFGQDNKEPLINLNNLKINQFKPVGADNSHAKLVLEDAKGNKIDAIGFSLAQRLINDNGQNHDWLASASANHFNGSHRVQLNIKNWR